MKPVALASLAVLLLTACSDQQPLQPPTGHPSALIMDGAHHGGNADFFFLPPLAADPTGGPNFDPGTFNPNLAPTAEVCTLTGDPAAGAVDCATDTQGRPVLVFGAKPMVLAVEQYQVTWDTKSPVLLDASKFYRIIVRGAPRGTLLGLLDVDPVTGGIKDVKTGEVVQFQDGRTLPIKVRIEQGAFGVTNPDHVEQVVTNRITTPTGTVDVTTNTGFAGARLVDNWLPAAAVAAGIDRVIVIIERVPVNNAVPATSCLKSGFKELEGCYRFRTDPDLQPYGPFNTTVIAGVCFEQPVHSDAPYEMFRREETGEQALVLLEDVDAPFLNCATFSRTPPPSVGVSPGFGPGRLLGLASAGLRTLLGRVGRALTPRTLHAVDLGAGGGTNRFSFFGWARRATMTKASATDNQVTLVGTKVLADPTVCLATLHPATRPLVGEPVTFSVTGGGGTVGGGTSVPRVTGSDGCASAPWVLGSTTAPAGNRLTAAAAASPGTVEFVATGVSMEVDAGGFHSCALNASGQAFCWGKNDVGQLGDGTTTQRLVATAVAGGLTFARVSAGGSVFPEHTCGMTATGVAYCWGGNGPGELGDGTTTNRLVPTAVAGGLTFASLSAGAFHTCGVTMSGAAYCWGFNNEGELGDGTTTFRLVPTPVAGGLTFAAVSPATFHTCGVTTSGAAYCWGSNDRGQLGDGTTTDRLVPTPVAGALAFTSVTAGGLSHTCGVTASGAYCWGFNFSGQLGDGTTTERLVPTPVAEGLTFAALSPGRAHTCGVTTSGAAYCWGNNFDGRLGDGTTTNRLVPAPVAGGLRFAVVSSDLVHTCGATTSGAVYCWGGNGFGQVGDGTTTTRLVPTAVVFAGNGAGVVRLTTSAGFDGQPAWSPDGAKIAFVSQRDGDAEIYATNADGTGVVRLTTSATNDIDPAWSPDGTKIAFTSFRDDPSGEIYVMNTDGTGVVRLTSSAGFDVQPAWSPDGAKIAFRSSRDGNSKIYLMNGDGTGVVRLTTGAGDDFHPAWSPDGTKIAFTSFRDDPIGEIYVMNADGTGVVRLTTNAGFDRQPAWSPDGTKIAFVSTRDGDFEIYVMNPDGSGIVRLTTSAGDAFDPAWSPDGAKIAFTSTRDDPNGEIYVIQVAGGGLAQLTTQQTGERSPP